MKINKIKINSFGKIKEKEIDLNENINIIYGKNEAGKSTLLKFITNSFFGISKNKKGKEISDYDKYKPWVGEEFSGRIEYELDNKEKYVIFRDFNKKNPKIYNEQMQDISKDFNIDKTRGNEFFIEQTKIDEDTFLSTLAINQEEVKLEKSNQNILLQKIANLVGTGEDNVSYKKAIDRLNKKQLDEIGTERSREKPINIVTRRIQNLEEEINILEKYEDSKYEIEEKENEITKEIQKIENESELLKEIKILEENKKIDEEKLKIKQDIKIENEEKIKNTKIKISNNINEYEEQKQNQKEEEKKAHKKEKKIMQKIIRLAIILLILAIIVGIITKNVIIIASIIIIYIIFIIINLTKLKKIKRENEEKLQKNVENINQINVQKNSLQNEVDILEKNIKQIEKEITSLQSQLEKEYNQKKEQIKIKYLLTIENENIQKYINLNNIQLINKIQEELIYNLNQKKLQLHTLKIDKQNIEPKLDNLASLEEELANEKQKNNQLKKLEKSINIAKEAIDKAYEKMKNTITPKFTQNLSQNISEITNGKYKKVKFNDEIGLMVELENGDYMPSYNLSVGTIDQLYLSLRLSMIDEFCKETIPIFLDESFAYFDNNRLENILKYIKDKFSNRQILIFTCTYREKEILEKNNINFNYIEL